MKALSSVEIGKRFTQQADIFYFYSRRYFSQLVLVVVLLVITTGQTEAKATLSAYMQQQLLSVRSLMEKESWSKAQNLLQKLEGKTSQNYAKALIAQSLGQIAIQRDDHVLALTHFQRAYGLDILAPEQNLQLLHGIGQLHCSVEAWKPCQQVISQWMQQAPEKIRADDQIMLAHAFSMTEDWRKVVKPVNAALKRRNHKAPLSWHQLGVAAYVHLRQWKSAVQYQQTLLSYYPDLKTEWRQLVSLHLQRKHYKSALATLRLGFQRELLRSASDYRQLAELMAYNGLPYIAANVINQGLTNKVLTKNIKNLQLQANLLLQAREYPLAAEVYAQLVIIEPKKRWIKQLAQLYITNQNWSEATRLLQSAVRSHPEANLNLLLGIALTNQQQYESARQSFEAAALDQKLRPMVQNWLQYLSQV